MKWSVLLCALAIAVCVDCSGRFKNIEKDVVKHYMGDNVRSFQSQWHKMKLPIENAIRQSLINMYGRGEMNVFVKSKSAHKTMTRGFLVSDNIVQVLIVNPTMRELPMIIAPEVNLCLEGNALRVEGGLSKIFIDAGYLMFRNHSAIEYTELDPERTSPFSLNQVQEIGNLAITADGCTFLGTGLVTLLGSSVSLGYNTFRVSDCKFNIEIFTEGLGTPPVMAPYFDKQQGIQLQNLMSRPIADEMYTKIQSALISYINTTAIFGLKKQPKYIYEQRQIFRKCAMYLEKAVRNANAAMMDKNKGVLKFNDWYLTWNDKADPKWKTSIAIKDLVISGLDTAYSINRGGPYYLNNSTAIAEEFYFHTLHMKGKFVIINETTTVERSFGGEIPDVHISLKVGIEVFQSKDEKLDQEKRMNKFYTVTSRGFELAIPDIGTSIKDRIAAHSIIAGYMYNTVPKRLEEILSEIFPKAVALEDSRLLKYAVTNKIQEPTKDNSDDEGDDEDDDGGDNGGNAETDTEDSDGSDQEEDNEVSESATKLKKSIKYVTNKHSTG